MLDVKWGSGCYQESLEQADLLAEALVQVEIFGKYLENISTNI